VDPISDSGPTILPSAVSLDCCRVKGAHIMSPPRNRVTQHLDAAVNAFSVSIPSLLMNDLVKLSTSGSGMTTWIVPTPRRVPEGTGF